MIDGCTLTVCRAQDAGAWQLFVLCTPPASAQDSAGQAAAIYAALGKFLQQAHVALSAIVRETIFFADIAQDQAVVRAVRDAGMSDADYSPALLEIGQPPLDEAHRLEVALHIEHIAQQDAQPLRVEVPTQEGAARGLCLLANGEKHLHAAGILGAGESAYEQTHAMFETAERLLQEAGMTFADVVRTWIHFSEMDRDYAQFNQARRAFFDAYAIDPPPASTGIGGIVGAPGRSVCLGLYAVAGRSATTRQVMTTPTLNEAPQYGADFSRGMRIQQGDGALLFVSGTASLDETGATVHQDDTSAQIDRMLLNLQALLAEQGADFTQVMSAITYLKHPADAALLQTKLAQAGFEGFPNALVNARICRPDLLCEIELLARL